MGKYRIQSLALGSSERQTGYFYKADWNKPRKAKLRRVLRREGCYLSWTQRMSDPVQGDRGCKSDFPEMSSCSQWHWATAGLRVIHVVWYLSLASKVLYTSVLSDFQRLLCCCCLLEVDMDWLPLLINLPCSVESSDRS
jgi:hypothetical protein